MSPGFMASRLMSTGFVASGISPGILGPGAVGARRGPSAPVLPRTLWGRGRCGIAGARRTAVFARHGDLDQPLDVAQVAHLLGSGDQRDRHALGAGARSAADAMDVGF